jgi:hypothetical protein
MKNVVLKKYVESNKTPVFQWIKEQIKNDNLKPWTYLTLACGQVFFKCLGKCR